MFEILTPSSDSLPKFITTWGALGFVFSVTYSNYLYNKFNEERFSILEKVAELRARNNGLRGQSKTEEQFTNLAFSGLKKSAADGGGVDVDVLKTIREVINASSDSITEIEVEVARLDVMKDRLIFNSEQLSRVNKLRRTLVTCSLLMILVGGYLWWHVENPPVN